MQATTDIILTSEQAEGTTTVVGKWFKQVGDAVGANDPLLEITTDKVTVEIAAPADGVLLEILKAEGEDVQPGDVLGRIGATRTVASTRDAAGAGPGPVVPARDAVEAGHGPPQQTPAVRRLLKEHGLDPSQIQGTGRDGRITADDVERFVTRHSALGTRHSARVPHTAMRKSIAAHMVHSMATAPHVTSVFEADLSSVLAHREAHQAAFGATGTKLTLTAYFVRAAVEALKAVPEANSRWHEDALEVFGDQNIGVATALEAGGLIVPVIHGAQDLDLVGIAERLHDLTTRARAGALTPKDVQGGTLTISNHGVSGSLLAAPIIINQPQSAILGVGKLVKRAVVVEDGGRAEVVIRPMVYVSLTIDHRVLDGFQANAFLSRWVEAIRSP
jgi:2-oxoglutarate dehydrogenase E2 component (dihydrolipoamide succinyltransferase)